MDNTSARREKFSSQLILIAVFAACSFPTQAAPTFSTPRDLSIFSVVAGSQVTFQVSASDSGNAVTLSSGAIPSGASFNPSTGDFTWTPTASPSQAGFYTIVFFANDNVGQSVIQVTINVVNSAAPCSLVVTSTGDGGVAGDGSLRSAINCANSHGPFQAITFNIPGSGVQTITPATPLPNIMEPAIIDGYSQLGASPNTSLSGDNATLLIVLNGSIAGSPCPGSSPGLNVIAGRAAIIQGLVVNNFCFGIGLTAANAARVRGNFLGTDSTGEVAQANGTGVLIPGTSNNTIGGNSPGARNLISGNTFGFSIDVACPPPSGACSTPANNLIQGNLIGTDATGLNPLPNGSQLVPGVGVAINGGANNNTIEDNVISYNVPSGVDMDSGIGTGVPTNNKVEGNTIAFNGKNGVRINVGAGNTISQNSIYGNGDPASGIRLGTTATDGVQLNQDCNTATGGANNYQNYPVLNSSSGSPITGTLNSAPNTTFTIEFFANNPAAVPVTFPAPAAATADPVGLGQGQTYIGSTTVTTNSSCQASFSFTPPPLGAGQVVTATATNQSTGDTSEFSDWTNTVTLASNNSPSVSGQSVTITASVSPGLYSFSLLPEAPMYLPPAPASTLMYVPGSVTFQEGATVLSGPTALTNGQASFSTSSLSAGSHTITAYYSDTTIPPTFISAIGTFMQQVEASTTTSIMAPTITYNANGIVTVTVSSPSGTPTGSVSLTVDGGAPMSQTLSGGSAIFTISSPNAGNHSLSASYAAQGNFAASSNTGTLLVNAAPTTTSIMAPTITHNANGSVTVTVSSGAGTPTGGVGLSVDGGAPMSQTLSGGSAMFTIPSPGAGTHSLGASYAAQGNFAASSSTGTLTVNPAPAVVSIGNLVQTFTGSPISVTTTVTPAFCGPAAVTYNSSSAPPSNIGTYSVVASVVNPNCTAPNATGTLIVNAFAASGCIYALNPSASKAFDASGGASIQTQCGIQVNSSNADAFDVSGGASVKATGISIVGGDSITGGATVTPAPKKAQPAVSDPLAGIAAPVVGTTCNFTNWHNAGTTLNPGTYCNGINISGGSKVTFNPGTYILLGGGLTISGGAEATGTGVTFYNTYNSTYAYKPISISGGSRTSLAAPRSGSLAGVLIFQDRSVSNTSQNTVSGGSGTMFEGAFYFPSTPLAYSGGSTDTHGAYTLIVASTMAFTGGSSSYLTVLGQ